MTLLTTEIIFNHNKRCVKRKDFTHLSFPINFKVTTIIQKHQSLNTFHHTQHHTTHHTKTTLLENFLFQLKNHHLNYQYITFYFRKLNYFILQNSCPYHIINVHLQGLILSIKLNCKQLIHSNYHDTNSIKKRRKNSWF